MIALVQPFGLEGSDMAKPTLKSSVTTINLNTSHPNTPPPYPLGSFAALYIVGILSVVVARYLEPLSLILAYPVISTIISRYVNARVIWWDQSNSIEEIFKAKLYFWILWPYQMPKYWIKIAIAKYL